MNVRKKIVGGLYGLAALLVATTSTSCSLSITETGGGGGDGANEGEGEDDSEAGEGEGEGEPTGQANGFACVADADCVSGTCTPYFGENAFFSDLCTVTCADDGDCDDVFGEGSSGACLGDSTAQYCFPACTRDEDCSSSTDALCRELVTGTSGCLPTRGGPCATDADCDDDESCTVFSGDEITWHCVATAVAGQRAGASCDYAANEEARANSTCEVDAHCAHGTTCADDGSGNKVCVLAEAASRCAAYFCLEGSCSGSCRTDADCPANHRCDFYDFGADPSVSELEGFCSPFRGSATPCTKESDCANGEHCGAARDGQANPITVCRAADPGDVDIGALCGDDLSTLSVVEPSQGCVSNLCFSDGYRRECRAVCLTDDDCGGNACVTYTGFPGVCMAGPRCGSDADCSGEDYCDVVATGDDVELFCRPKFGDTLSGGDTCDGSSALFAELRGITCFADTDCAAVDGALCELATRTCLPPLASICGEFCDAGSNQCFRVCTEDEHCGVDGLCAGDWYEVGTNDDGSAIYDFAGGCHVETGSREPCTKTADCVTGEVCQSRLSLTGEPTPICVLPAEGRARAGEACGEVDGLRVACVEGTCQADSPTSATCRALCASDDDCPEPQSCQELVFGVRACLE